MVGVCRGVSLGVSVRIRQDREAFTTSSISESFVEANERSTLWGLVAPYQRGCQLERVGCTERMRGEQPPRSFTERMCGRNHINIYYQGLESFKRLREGRRRQTPFSMTPVERGLTFDRACPPQHGFRIGAQ